MEHKENKSSLVAARYAVVADLFNRGYQHHGFLPSADPLAAFPLDSQYACLDQLGRDLPERLLDRGFRKYAQSLVLPMPEDLDLEGLGIRGMRLYYVRVAFLASAYVNQVGEESARVLPANIARPLRFVCQRLSRPPILSYDGYALYNWRRIDPAGPIALGNIDTLQNFVQLYDEHWFIIVHVAIEALSAPMIAAMVKALEALKRHDATGVDLALGDIVESLRAQIEVLRRIPEHMDPALYYKIFRPYIRFFSDLVYADLNDAPVNLRGETGAQSSIMPLVVAFLKILHASSRLTSHLADMRNYMPSEHRALIEAMEDAPGIRDLASKDSFNQVLEAIAEFRQIHFGWAEEYLHRRCADDLGTGGTPYRRWLQQLIDETLAYRKT